MLLSLFLAFTSQAASYETHDATVVGQGIDCNGAYVRVQDGILEVDCKAGGFVRPISPAHTLKWEYKRGWATLRVQDDAGSSTLLTVPKIDFQSLRDALRPPPGTPPTPCPPP